MYDAVRKGGYIIFSMRDQYYEPLGHKAKVDEMVREGKFKYVKAFSWLRNEQMADDKEKSGIFHPEKATVWVYQRM